MREDVAGRANVEDTPELRAYYGELGRLDAGALWTVANTIEPWEPVSRSRAHQRMALAMLTPNRAAAAWQDTPSATAATTRSRRSTDSAFDMPVGLQHRQAA